MAVSSTANSVQLTIPSNVSTSTSFDYPNRVNSVSDLVVQETTLTPRIADSITFNQSSDQFTLAGHNLVTGDIVQFDTTAIDGFSAGADYYVIRIDENIFQLATSVANANATPAVPVTTTGTSNVDVTTLIRAGEQPLTRTLELDVDYSATPSTEGGLVTSVAISPTSSALSAGKFVANSTLTIYRETDFKQDSNYEPNAIIPANTLESNLDKLTMMAQQLKDDVSRSVRFAETVVDPANLKISFDADQRAGKILSFDSEGEFSISQEIGVWRSAWQSGRSYAARDLVFDNTSGSDYQFSIYIAKTAHTSDTTTAPLADGSGNPGANWDRVLDASFFATKAGSATGAADLAEAWASKTDGSVDGTEYSSKAYAIGGTGVDGAAGSAKDWAIKTDGEVISGEYSAKHWANSTNVTTVAGLDTEIQALASVATEIGRLGLELVIADMAALGDPLVVADMADLADNIGAIADKLNLAGGEMSGFLTLHADPTANLHAATKQYVDAKVSKSGDTMTGDLTLANDPTNNLHAAPKQYVDTKATALAIALG